MEKDLNHLLGKFFLNLDFNELNTATVSSGMLFVSVESKNQKVIRKCIVLKTNIFVNISCILICW